MRIEPMSPIHYDRRSIALHWLTAILVVALWGLGQTIDWFPKGVPRIGARSTHIALGAALALVISIRIWWRFAGGAHLPPAGAGSTLDALATWVHRALYVLLVLTVALGLANAWIRGDSVFGLFKIPAIRPGDKVLRELVENLHGLAANVLAGTALFHAAAALFHQFVLKDSVLARMIPALADRRRGGR